VGERLRNSASPYLRGHADDPVDWREWDDAAFSDARALGRPVMLSCGYSACHWCHVMQRESFRDPTTAALINERLVAIKVDRQLRPDIDALYQDYVAATAGAGGWPLTVFLTPEKLPIAGGTYFPREPGPAIPSLQEVVHAVAEAYDAGGPQLETTARAGLDYLRARAADQPEGDIDRGTLDYAADFLVQIHDPVFGGMRGAPKFPQLPTIEFLAAYQRLAPDPDVAFAIEQTLLSIVRGGIYDQVGGGVHRYAMDAEWRMPHFEKMLYDQGLLLSALAAAAPIASGDEVRAEYAHVAREIAAFLTREMTAPGGGFIAALSAETQGIEGATYTWTVAELSGALGAEDLALTRAALGACESGAERFTLHRPGGRGADADRVDGVLAALRAARDLRPRPDVDDAVLTAWNAIAARGLMEAGATFGDQTMVDAGCATTRYLLDTAPGTNGVVRLLNAPEAVPVRLLEDAAHLTSAALSAAQATGDGELLGRAAALHADTLSRFAEGSALYMTALPGDLPVRPREGGDGAIPSGASTVIENAVHLGLALGDDSALDLARAALRRTWAVVDFAPEQAGRALAAAVALERAGLL
jgi:uncharacterized protein